MDYDQTPMPANYDAGRGYRPETLAHWLDVIARAAPADGVSRILDLGCGTGRYSNALAERFGADIIAVDPSEAMLVQARRKPSSRVRHVRASGEDIPLPDASVDMVFMSMVFHHFRDPERVAVECRRVLRDGGRVILRAGTMDQVHTYPFVPFFAGSEPILREVLPLRAATEAVFARAGFATVSHELVRSEVAANWSEYVAKLAHRADSILIRLSDAQFEDGMAALRQHAAAAEPSEPVIELVDFFAFQRARSV